MNHLKELIGEIIGVDLIIISAGCGFINYEYEKNKELLMLMF